MQVQIGVARANITVGWPKVKKIDAQLSALVFSRKVQLLGYANRPVVATTYSFINFRLFLTKLTVMIIQMH